MAYVNPGTGTDYLNLSQDPVVSPIVNTWIANVKANGGSLTDIHIGKVNAFLKGLNQLGLLSKCTYFNPCMGNNWQAAVTNVINVTGTTYMTTSGTFDDSYFNEKFGWILPASTTINTGYNPVGQSISTFISCQGFSQNISNSTLRFSGSNTHSILKTNDQGAAYYTQGRSALNGSFQVLTNIQGNHILYQSVAGVQWYIDGVLYSSNTTTTAGTFPSGNFSINVSYNSYNMYFNATLSGASFPVLHKLIDALNSGVGRITAMPTTAHILAEGDSITASYNSAGGLLSPLYLTTLTQTLKLSPNTWNFAQLAVSGKLAETMLTDATGNTQGYNTYNFATGQQNIYLYMGGTNSIGNGTIRTADDVYTNLIVPTLRNRVAAGYTPIIETLPLSNSSYTGFLTGGLANYNSTTLGAKRLNYLIKTDPNNYNGVNAYTVVPTDERPEAASSTNTTYFQDGLHPTVAFNALRVPGVAQRLNAIIGNKSVPLNYFVSPIPQVVTTAITGTRDYRNYELGVGSSFVVPDAQIFVGMEYILTNTSGGNISVTGGVTATIATGTTVKYRSNGVSWTTM